MTDYNVIRLLFFGIMRSGSSHDHQPNQGQRNQQSKLLERDFLEDFLDPYSKFLTDQPGFLEPIQEGTGNPQQLINVLENYYEQSERSKSQIYLEKLEPNQILKSEDISNNRANEENEFILRGVLQIQEAIQHKGDMHCFMESSNNEDNDRGNQFVNMQRQNSSSPMQYIQNLEQKYLSEKQKKVRGPRASKAAKKSEKVQKKKKKNIAKGASSIWYISEDSISQYNPKKKPRIKKNYSKNFNSNEPSIFNAFSVIDPSENKIKSLRCMCKKSKCLKKYCECFSSGNKCLDGCQCTSCQNN